MSTCRSCQAPIKSFMTFGQNPIANGFLTAEETSNEYFYEMETAFCESCGMFQLVEQPDPSMMFHENYAFFSQTSKAMAVHFEKFANDTMAKRLSGDDPFVVELGSNDGIMLRHFASKGIRHLGIEPSANVAEAARENGVNTLCDFFNMDTANKVLAEHGPADVIQAANVMCHIPDLQGVAKGAVALLKPEGVLIFEDPYLGDVIEKTSYDQIYDEHVFLFSVRSVNNAFAPHGLVVIDAEPQVTHGGSMRYTLGRPEHHTPSDAVIAQQNKEQELGLESPATYDRFRENCEKSRDDLMTLLRDLKAQGKRVVGYGATSKSTTITSYCGITPDLIEFVSDTTPTKQGKLTPGAHIPVKTPDNFHNDFPDYALLFAWNHAKEIMSFETDFAEQGGKWIVYVPEVKTI